MNNETHKTTLIQMGKFRIFVHSLQAELWSVPHAPVLNEHNSLAELISPKNLSPIYGEFIHHKCLFNWMKVEVTEKLNQKWHMICHTSFISSSLSAQLPSLNVLYLYQTYTFCDTVLQYFKTD